MERGTGKGGKERNKSPLVGYNIRGFLHIPWGGEKKGFKLEL